MERQEQILLSLERFNFLTRSHIQRLHRLGGDRNAQKVLRQMEAYLHSFREGYDTVYYLNKSGREMIGAKKQVKRTLQTTHNLMRVDFFFHMGCPPHWFNERKVEIGGKVCVIPDALFFKDKQYNFLEVDNRQTMAENKAKVHKYRKMFESGVFQNDKNFGYFPTLHIVTVNKSRMKRFREICDGLPFQVYLIDEIK
ncbi:replication-relaxation family protein [Aneurinibacillus migulanus]|nr:replication-relaxation family protein [Aneurinibacillus migulanus]MED1614385.1 replication-relaxation family protein [Aneurinibacillus migulanus]